MTQFASIRKLPTPELHAWALDFPAAGAAARIGDRGLYLQGWALGKGEAACAELVVRIGSGEEARDKVLAFSNPRPDVIRRVLGAVPDGHPRLRCGFIAHLDPVPEQFTLGVNLEGQTVWLCDVTLEGTPVPRTVSPATHQVIQGSEGWLYLDNDTNHSVDQYTGRLTLDPEDLARWSDYLDACASIAADTHARHAVMIAASKEQVLPEYYPHAKGAHTVHEQVLGLSRPQHQVIDTAALLRARPDRAQCFIKTDTHWTDRGAMQAALALIAQLDLDTEAARRCWAGDVYHTIPFAGDLGSKLQPALVAPTEFLQAPPATQDAAFDNHLPNIGRVLVFGCEDAPWQATLLLFGASSSYPMLKYLKRVFRRIVFVHSAGNVDVGIVAHERPDYLVMQTTARFMITPPGVGFVLRHAVAEKLRTADAQVRARAQASAAVAARDPKNLPYCAMLDIHEH